MENYAERKNKVTRINKCRFVELFGFPAFPAVTDEYSKQLVAHH